MPVPDKNVFADRIIDHFKRRSIVLPVKWEEPGPQFQEAFFPEERKVAPNPPGTLFKAATCNHYHVMAAKVMGELFKAYLEGVVSAVCDGLDDYMKKVVISQGVINGAVGRVPIGGVSGPSLYPAIMASAPRKTPQELKYSTAIAKALSFSWKLWEKGLSGTLAYPSFAAFPGPNAPPTPNTPVPLASFVSVDEGALSRDALKTGMLSALNDPLAYHAAELFDSFAYGFTKVFRTFKAETRIQTVLGTGPVPSFAPPSVPAGPVVGGRMLPDGGIWV